MKFLNPSYLVLRTFYNNPEKNLKLILQDFLKKENSIHNDSITRTVYGVIRKDNMLSYVIKNFSTTKINKISSNNLILLKIGIYLLIFSRSYPDYAVVNEIVKIASIKSKKYINGILRNIARNRDKTENMIKNIQDLEIKYSISKPLINNLRIISKNLEKDLEYLNKEPLFHIRTNNKIIKFNEFKNLLLENKIEFKEQKKFKSLEIQKPGKLIKKYLNKRYFYFQNTGSQIISLIAAEFSNKHALDCCAAPGTKSITLNQIRPNLRIFANDINFKRIAIMNKFLRENSLEKIQIFVSDITKPAIKNRFDFIILDAPCTSSGTLRKNPDLKLKINDKYIKKNATKQNEIIKAVVNKFSNTYVLYSVCSFIKEETEGIMKNISENKKTEIIDISEILSFYDLIYKKGNSGFYLLPNPIINNDIFYLSLFKIKP